ncbi:MAG: hypothetical protein GXZ09_04155 [Syntrophomonadaceae bacterium]|jgi:hypothetical protein|nr:hypothetical protein [Syntrophomonadaceae bacterium]
MKHYRNWTFATLILILLPLLAVAGFNWYIDPLWLFEHSHQYNNIQAGFDERQQKTNRLAFGSNHYDMLILGSSRVTYIDQHDFAGYKAFNYAADNMLLDEFYDYIEFAKQENGRDFDVIVLGLDFSATNRNLIFEAFQEPSFYIQTARQPIYRLKTLLSTEVLERSWDNYKFAQEGIPKNFFYDRQNVKTLLKVPDAAERDKKVWATVAKYEADIYAGYQYGDIREKLTKIRDANPDSRLLVFTTPDSWPMFELMVRMGLYPYYRQWLTDIVDVFGEVYNFMTLNTITNNLDNFYDGTHVYPEVGTLMVHRLLNLPHADLPADFGVLITPQNLEQHLKIMDRQVREVEARL